MYHCFSIDCAIKVTTFVVEYYVFFCCFFLLLCTPQTFAINCIFLISCQPPCKWGSFRQKQIFFFLKFRQFSLLPPSFQEVLLESIGVVKNGSLCLEKASLILGSEEEFQKWSTATPSRCGAENIWRQSR